MNINFTGHHVEVTPALREFTKEKLNHLKRYVSNITRIKVTFDIQKLTQIAEASLHIPHHEIFARAEGADMYSVVDSLMDKLVAQVKKVKDKDTSRHHGA